MHLHACNANLCSSDDDDDEDEDGGIDDDGDDEFAALFECLSTVVLCVDDIARFTFIVQYMCVGRSMVECSGRCVRWWCVVLSAVNRRVVACVTWLMLRETSVVLVRVVAQPINATRRSICNHISNEHMQSTCSC